MRYLHIELTEKGYFHSPGLLNNSPAYYAEMSLMWHLRKARFCVPSLCYSNTDLWWSQPVHWEPRECSQSREKATASSLFFLQPGHQVKQWTMGQALFRYLWLLKSCGQEAGLLWPGMGRCQQGEQGHVSTPWGHRVHSIQPACLRDRNTEGKLNREESKGMQNGVPLSPKPEANERPPLFCRHPGPAPE